MPDPFADSKSKLAWAEKRFTDLQREVNNFGNFDTYKEVVEPHPDKPHHQVRKIKLTQGLPLDIAHIAEEVVNSLRSALDVAGYAVALASGKTNPKYTAFPFAGSLGGMAQALGRCKDIPAPIQSLFVGFQPYEGGDDLLWALNEICNTEKHKILVPVGTGAYPMGACASSTGGLLEIPIPHVWDNTKNEMILITLGPGVKFDYQFNFRLFVAFGEIKVVTGSELVGTLYKIGHKVDIILAAIEFESRRLGLIK